MTPVIVSAGLKFYLLLSDGILSVHFLCLIGVLWLVTMKFSKCVL